MAHQTKPHPAPPNQISVFDETVGGEARMEKGRLRMLRSQLEALLTEIGCQENFLLLIKETAVGDQEDQK